MTVISSVQDESKWTFELEIVADALDEHVSNQKNVIRANAEYPGFRKGKVPDHVLAMRFGPQFGVSEGIDQAIQQVARTVIKEQSLNVVGTPQVTKMDPYKPQQPLRFTIEIEVIPSVTLGTYKGLTHHVSLAPVTDEQVTQEIQSLMKRYTLYPTVDRPIKMGDLAVIDINATDASGAVIEQWSKDKGGYSVGSQLFGAQLDEALVGKSAGDSFGATETFPDGFELAAVAGKTISFEGTVSAVRSADVSELTDELVAIVFQVPTIVELKQVITNQLQEVAQRRFEEDRVQALMSQVVDGMTVKVSDTLAALEVKSIVEEEKERLNHKKVTLAHALKEANLTEDDWKAALKPQATQRLKAALAYSEILSLENIELGTDDVVTFVLSKKPEWRREDVLANWASLNMPSIIRVLTQERALEVVVSSSVYEPSVES